MASAFEALHPCTSYFVKEVGWIEIGYDADGPLTSFIRAIDMGGMVWEGADEYPSVDAAHQALEIGLRAWMQENGIEIGSDV